MFDKRYVKREEWEKDKNRLVNLISETQKSIVLEIKNSNLSPFEQLNILSEKVLRLEREVEKLKSKAKNNS